MKHRMLRVLWAAGLIMGVTASAMAASNISQKRQTTLGLYATARQAYDRYAANPGAVHILDVRTPGEYVFVGHAPMAVNIPIKFHTPGLSKMKKLLMPVNDNFAAEVQKKFSKTDTLYVMCRSGSRSALAVNKLAEAGFSKAYNVIDGFEGDKDKKGKRTVNGWKNSGAPWTYKNDAGLMYIP